MRKEVIIAILIGLVMGLFITYGFYQSQKVADPNQISTIDELETAEPISPVENGKLTLFSPEDETVQKDKTVKVAGSTSPNSFVVIFVNNSPIITQADETGNFSREVTLEPLANIISVYSIETDGGTNMVQRAVVVYDQEISQDEAQATAADDDENEEQ